ncbi:MAG: hypothetical protein L7W43_14060 [Rubripirellula sp.]|nr:hypothetical protein [Rhodopirellula sp.]MCH1440782.1 hypothetical protein [Rubripirellula sp.]OUX08662.1 MAG: hypothetical protein CBE00_01275 [Planctomycetaceae bacterium TMED240]
MSRVAFSLTFVFCLIGTSTVWGQSTISNSPFELSTGQGLWGAFLPAYSLGEDAGGAPALSDSMDALGYHGDLKMVRRFLGTRTSFEGRAFYATAESTANGGDSNLSFLNPSDGSLTAIPPGATRLRSNVDNYGFDLLLRDTWITRFGGLSAGCAFSYIGFDQTFNSTAGGADLLREKLDSDLRGGKGFVGWDGCFCGHATNIDLLFGYYDMNASYGSEAGLNGPVADQEMTKNISTIETNFTTRREFREIQVGATIGMTYFTDLPTIQRNVGQPVTIGTDDAVTLKFLFEILL